MIANLAIQAIVSVLHFLLAQLPVLTPPSWLTGAAASTQSLLAVIDGMGTWIPWPVLLTVSALCLTTWLVGFGIKVIRIIASFVTLGGGSAA